VKDQPPTNYDTDDSGQHIDIIGLLWKTISLKKLLDSLFGVGLVCGIALLDWNIKHSNKIDGQLDKSKSATNRQ